MLIGIPYFKKNVPDAGVEELTKLLINVTLDNKSFPVNSLGIEKMVGNSLVIFLMLIKKDLEEGKMANPLSLVTFNIQNQLWILTRLDFTVNTDFDYLGLGR